jgi:hypothetical protein
VPQLSAPVTAPQFFASLRQNAKFVSAMHALPQTFAVPPPPHVLGEVHVPHDPTVRALPQLSVPETEPQFLLKRPQNAESPS